MDSAGICTSVFKNLLVIVIDQGCLYPLLYLTRAIKVNLE